MSGYWVNSGDAAAQRVAGHMPAEPNIISFRIERMVNGYIVYETKEGSGPTTSGPRHLVTSREKLIELLTGLAPQPLEKPAVAYDGRAVEERKW